MNHSKIILLFFSLFVLNLNSVQSKERVVLLKDTNLVSKPDVLAEFPGGESKLLEFVSNNIKYPERAKKKGKVGTTYVSFIVKETGEVADIKTNKGIPDCSACDEEAMRMIKQMPKWKPAQKGGKAVAVQYVLPVKFSLK